jgi:hypothetical protein
MAFHVGWRNFWWLNVAMFVTIIILMIFFFPETKWHRIHPKDIHRSQNTSPSNGETDIATTNTELKQPAEEAKQENPPIIHREEGDDDDPFLHRGSPSKRQFHLWQTSPRPLHTLLLAFWIPWKLHLYPIVELASFIVSWSASCFLTLNLTQSQAFAAPPYNLSSQSIGFTNFAILIGAFIGLATNGKLSDWVSMRATRKNRGIREPEMRLPAMIPYLMISVLGNFVVAFGYQYHWDWRVKTKRTQNSILSSNVDFIFHQAIVIIGYTAAGIQVAALPAIASTYAVDSYKPVASSIFVAITVNKNLWGYGFSKFITPWIEQSGYVRPIMMNMCLLVLWCLFGIPFYFFGKSCRKWTAGSGVHNM